MVLSSQALVKHKCVLCWFSSPAGVVTIQAIAAGVSLIVTYHPRPFAKFKRLTTEDVTQRIVLWCVVAGIAVWSPHTACDAAKGGVNDWLAAGVSGGGPTVPVAQAAGEAQGTGSGRIATLPAPISAGELVARVKVGSFLSQQPFARSIRTNTDCSSVP
jgi:putative NIF3 family GTP cyclohydrolase 1 type 2